MDIMELSKIGLKEKEAKVYVALLKEVSCLANQLARKTNVLRSSIYDYLEILLEKGFITYTIQSGKKYFQAIGPQKILDNFEEKKLAEEEALRKIVPELIKLQNISEKISKAEVFEGKEGMKSVMSYILKRDPKEILIYGSSGVSYKLLPFFMEHWHKQRIKQRIYLRIIYNNTPGAKLRIREGPTLKNAEVRFLSLKDASLTGTIIYNDVVVLTVWDMENPFAVSVENKKIAQTYKENFEILWKYSKK